MKPLSLSMGPLYVRIVLCQLDVDATSFLQRQHLQSYSRTTRVHYRGRGRGRGSCLSQTATPLPTGVRLCYWFKQQSNSIFASNSEVDVVDFLDRWQWLLGQKLLKKLPTAHHGDEQRRGQELIQRLLHSSILSLQPTKTRGICSTKPKPVGPEACSGTLCGVGGLTFDVLVRPPLL